MGPGLPGQRRKPRMTKTPKRPRLKKIRRNPLARELATGKFRARVVAKKIGTYQRRPKHPLTEDEPQ
jgi:hypothetical protein